VSAPTRPGPSTLSDAVIAEAGRMRADHATYGEIAAVLGLRRRQNAHVAVQAALARGLVKADQLPEAARDVRAGREASRRASADRGAPPAVARDWRDQAACRDEAKPVDPETFFANGDDWSSAGNRARARKAKAVCRRCPVADACLLDAFARGDDWAVRGGTIPDERRATQQRRNRSTA
jgi:WhiB family redox-sensing transcriptional regulator